MSIDDLKKQIVATHFDPLPSRLPMGDDLRDP
jgi:hypothetical protein